MATDGPRSRNAGILDRHSALRSNGIGLPGASAMQLAVVLLSAFALTARAEDRTPVAAVTDAGAQRPLWEIGIAGAIGGVADYPGSDRYSLRAVPFPYFVYRGNFFRSDEKGARLRAPVSSSVELDFSGGASFPARSGDSGPRKGMADLDYLFELGPNLRITLGHPAPGMRLLSEWPVRAAFSTNGRRVDYRGLVFAPDVGVQTQSLLGSPWFAYADVGPVFASTRFQGYFFEVAPQYAVPGRPAYVAHGGYLGTRLELGASRNLGKTLRVFFYGRIDDYDGGANVDSPLFKSKAGYTAFTGFAWSFLGSRNFVTAPADGS
jgi:outer membrane scaffolding protein for murein synthesis (MipA/OmpV family)